MKYPRVEILKKRIFVPVYKEEYEVQTMRPNKPMLVKYGMNKAKANSFARQELSRLKSEGYAKAVFETMLIDLRKFIL